MRDMVGLYLRTGQSGCGGGPEKRLEVCSYNGCHGNVTWLPRGWPLPQNPMKPETQKWRHTHTLGFAELFLRVLSASSLISLSPWAQGHEKRVGQGTGPWRPATMGVRISGVWVQHYVCSVPGVPSRGV